MSQSVLARIYVFPVEGQAVPTIDQVANGTIDVSSEVLYFDQHKFGNRDCVIVDMDGEVSSFFDLGTFVEAISASSKGMVVAVTQEGFFIPCYNFVFTDNFPYVQADQFMADFYLYVKQELDSNQYDCSVALRQYRNQ